MKGVCLSLHVYELDQHHGKALYEWLLECGKEIGLEEGMVLQAIAGFGRKKQMHEEHFFELASNVPIQVEFITSEEKALKFLERLKKEKLSLFYVISQVEKAIV